MENNLKKTLKHKKLFRLKYQFGDRDLSETVKYLEELGYIQVVNVTEYIELNRINRDKVNQEIIDLGGNR